MPATEVSTQTTTSYFGKLLEPMWKAVARYVRSVRRRHSGPQRRRPSPLHQLAQKGLRGDNCRAPDLEAICILIGEV